MAAIALVDVTGNVLVNASGIVLAIEGGTPTPPVQRQQIPGIEWQALEKLGWQPYGIP